MRFLSGVTVGIDDVIVVRNKHVGIFVQGGI
jgi:hypothetical protein